MYVYHSFLIHLSANGYLGCFHVLAIVNSTVINIGVHMSLSILVSLVCMPRSGIAGSYGRVPEEEDKKKGHEKIFEVIIVEIATEVQETQRVPNRINPRQNTPRHILIKLIKLKNKEEILKAAREKQQITHKGIPIRITADLSIETLQAGREWQEILKVMKDNNNPDYYTQQGSHSNMKEK